MCVHGKSSHFRRPFVCPTLPLSLPHSPSLADAVAACKAAGAVRVIVAPYFLSRGRHVDADIPALASAAADTCGLPVTVAAPLGVDAALAGVIEARVAAALDEV